jgi:hypothetical protein
MCTPAWDESAAAVLAIGESQLRVDGHHGHSAVGRQEQAEGRKDQEPFHGCLPLGRGSLSELISLLEQNSIHKH